MASFNKPEVTIIETYHPTLHRKFLVWGKGGLLIGRIDQPTTTSKFRATRGLSPSSLGLSKYFRTKTAAAMWIIAKSEEII